MHVCVHSTYNSEAECAAEGEVIQAVFLPTGCTSTYDTDDDAAAATGSYKLSCSKNCFETSTYPTSDCTGPANVYDDDFYTVTDDAGGSTVCYNVDDSSSDDPLDVAVQYTTFECKGGSGDSSGATTTVRAAGAQARCALVIGSIAALMMSMVL
jgi:hypothetical protein